MPIQPLTLFDTPAGPLVVGMTWDEALTFLGTGTRTRLIRRGPDKWIEYRRWGGTDYRLVFLRTDGPYRLAGLAEVLPYGYSGLPEGYRA